MDSLQLHLVSVEGCDVVRDEVHAMNLFACGLMIPDESLEFNHWMTNSMRAGHRRHHELGHSDHTEEGNAGWGLCLFIVKGGESAGVNCPGNQGEESIWVKESTHYEGLQEPSAQWVEGLEI